MTLYSKAVVNMEDKHPLNLDKFHLCVKLLLSCPEYLTTHQLDCLKTFSYRCFSRLLLSVCSIRLTQLIFSDHMNIIFFIRLIVSFGGFGKDVKGYMSFGSAYDFITTILPISDSFL